MRNLVKIITEEIETYSANFPSFGDRLSSINEFGEGNLPPYSYTFSNISDEYVQYEFTTEDGDDYEVNFNRFDYEKKIWNLDFKVVGDEHDSIINKGRMGRIMSTMIKIVNEFINKYQPNIIKFEPIKSKGANDVSRFNLYMAYVKKNMRPDYKVYEYKPYIVIEKLVKTFNKKPIQV